MLAVSVLFRRWRCRRGVLRTLGSLWLAGCWCVWLAPAVLGSSLDVRFDAPSLVSCRDVTTDEFKEANPQARLVEARFEITALSGDDRSGQGLQYVYRFVSPAGSVQVVDYAPRTSQATPLAGNVSVERTEEKSRSLVASLSGGWEPLARGGANADLAGKSLSHIRYELKPPVEATLVAGTVERGTGVYFQLRPSAQTAWEGSHEFMLVLQVSRDWRGDVLYVRCEAQQGREGRMTTCGVSRFVVGLYRAGDEEARMAAEDLNRAEAALRRSVARRQQEIQRRATPTVIHRVGALLDMYDPPIPDAWLDRLVYGPTPIQEYEFLRYLPDEVRRRAEEYAQVKRRMSHYDGSRVAQHAGLACEAR